MTWVEVAQNEGHNHVLSNEVVQFLIVLAEEKVTCSRGRQPSTSCALKGGEQAK